MGYFIEDFIEETNAAQTRDEAFLCYQKALKRLGFDSAVYTFVTDHLEAGQRAGHGVQCNYPGDWMAYYQEKGYQAIDPVILRVKETVDAFRWQDLAAGGALTKQQDCILHEAQDAGLHGGVGIPLYGPRGELAGVGLASSLKDAMPDKATLSKLNLLTVQFHQVYCSLSAQETGNAGKNAHEPLTPRETEIMQWCSIGKTVPEIALILNCRENTVRWHIKQVYTKLQANTQTLAVTKAIRLGYVTLDLIRVV